VYSRFEMRTTLTIDDDVAFGLKKAQKESPEKSFKEIVNEHLRRGLATPKPRKAKARFKVKAYSLGLREGLNLDNIEKLLDKIEGPFRK
jgi:hypothetical protein